jgi:regulator of cell morphogenesis and NO signaling
MTEMRRELTIESTATVNEILAQYPEAVSVFNLFGIDACCGGDATIDDAARRDGAEPDALLQALDAVIVRGENAR